MIESLVLSHQAPEEWRAQAEIFNEIFFVFLAIGTIVGIVVVTYTLLHLYKYRDRGDDDGDFDAPVLGEIPTGQQSGKSKKLFLSFGLSALIVISLVVYAYGLLLVVEQGPAEDVEPDMEVEVVGFQFGWEFNYENGHSELNTMHVPEDSVIKLQVTSQDVWHNFGVAELRIKADSIPGQYASTWFTTDEPGEYLIMCYELCGSGHSDMDGEIVVMEQAEFDDWYAENEPSEDDEDEENGANDEEEEEDS